MADEPVLGPADALWMTQFHELQKQQVAALIQQNENQRTQLDILTMQLEVEKERRLPNHPINGQLEAKKEAGGIIVQQQMMQLPSQDSVTPMQRIQSQDLEIGEFNQDAQDFEIRYPSYGVETPQHQNHHYQDQGQQHYQQPQDQQGSDSLALPRITDLDSPDNRLLVALGYNMPPLQAPSLSAPFTPTNNRCLNSHDNSVYLTPEYPINAPEPILGSVNHSANKITAPSVAPKAKRPRLIGPALPEYSSPRVMNVPNGSSYHHGQQNEALQSYAAGVGKLAFALSRKDLEECIMELAFREEDFSAAFYHNAAFGVGPKEGLVRSCLLTKSSRGGRNILLNKDLYAIGMGLRRSGGLGSFGKVPLERMSFSIHAGKLGYTANKKETTPLLVLIHIISFLPIGCALTFILSICKSFRALMSEPSLWSQRVIEPRTSTFSSNGFIRFLRSIPETSIRYFSFDTLQCEPTALGDIVDLMLKKKHFGMLSLHLAGRKLSHAMILSALKRLWSENLATFSLTEVTNSKMDPEIVNKAFLPLMPNLRRLRLEGGVWKVKELKMMSCIHGQLRNAGGSRLIGDNRLTHLSFVGKNTAICWDDLKNFGKWFSELEELFINCVYADEPTWFEKYADGPATAEINHLLVGTEYASKKYRTPTNADIAWHSMSRLRYFGCENIGDGQNKKCVKLFEDIHAAHIWSLIKGSNRTLERLEISRGEEHFRYERGKSGMFPPWPTEVGYGYSWYRVTDNAV